MTDPPRPADELLSDTADLVADGTELIDDPDAIDGVDTEFGTDVERSGIHRSDDV
ncbi:hypothetical protein ACW9HR_37210 [Nocardia gipuzkoensis]